MSQSKINKKKLFNMAYGIGASIVILGALFKIMHFKGGGLMLTIGMVVEAIVFFISAFEPVDDDLDWSKVYPELAGGKSKNKLSTPNDAESMLSKKIDNLLKEAKLDVNLVSSLGSSIKNFQGAVQPLTDASRSITATNDYNEQMSRAAAHMESLNGLYQSQLNSVGKQSEMNAEMIENSYHLQQQMQSLAKNLSSLNDVYGGMLSAMTNK